MTEVSEKKIIEKVLDGELSQAEQSFVREHIASCPECRSVYDAFSAVSEQMHEEEPLPDGLHEKIKGKAEEENRYSVDKISVRSGMPCPCHIRRS